MIRVKYILLLVCLFFLLSCTRNGGSNNPGDGYWQLGNTQYKIIYANRGNENGYFMVSGIDEFPSRDTLKFYFSSMPTTNGSYKAVSCEFIPVLNTDEVGITIPIYHSGIGFGTGILNNISWQPAQKVDVTLNDGKFQITIPPMTACYINPLGLDTIYLKGLLIER